MIIQLTAIDHIYLSVSDFPRAEAFYDALMNALGFRKGTNAIVNEAHRHYYNRDLQITIRPARVTVRTHDAYSLGLHHICMRVPIEPSSMKRREYSVRSEYK